MSIAEKTTLISANNTTIAENEQRVYDAGKTAEWENIWYGIQNGGTRENYASVFRYAGWSDSNFKPRYIIKPTDATYMCANASITTLPEGMVNMSKCTAGNYCFAWTYKMINLTVDFSSAVNLNGAFQFCAAETLDITLSESYVNHTNTFKSMSKLTNLKIRGILAANNVSFSDSPLLTKDSLVGEFGILTALADKSADTSKAWTLIIGETNLAKLTDAEKAIATQKGWTLA